MGSAYSLDNDTFVELPVSPRYDPVMGEEQADNAFETNMGNRWIYGLYDRDRWELTFILTNAQLPAFRAMHDAVDGQRTPFYFRLTDVSPAEFIYARKEQGFLPRGIGEATDTGETIWEYKLILIGEVDADAIEP